ncbi:MAG: metallophosphoesterase family protein [Clostridia bacterium]|nr:metallophosphoesterase family protein [Clostridia bacterium]
MKLGILSDTHDLLRMEVLHALSGADVILHAGDICSEKILERLSAIAPTHAVRGNADKAWAEHLPAELDLVLGEIRVFMTHKKKDLPEDLSPYDLVICGHSHQYLESRLGGTVFLNPGSCGPRRFHQAITLAVADVSGRDINVHRIDIAHALPKTVPDADVRSQIEAVVKATQKGVSPSEIARKHGWDPDMCEQIARLYVTHPGVTVDGIMWKMGI